MAVDGQGRPVRFILTGGQRNDITQAPALLAGFRPKCVLADKGYDSRQLVAQIHSLGAQPVIPPRSCQQPRACDKALYRLRNRIERCFARLKQFRRIATRLDRKPSHFLAFLYLASIPLWVGGKSIRPRSIHVQRCWFYRENAANRTVRLKDRLKKAGSTDMMQAKESKGASATWP